MIKVILVDDNKPRSNKLLKRLGKSDVYKYIHLEECETADEARLLTKSQHFDLMILDVVLPKKHGNTQTAATGLKLLHDLNNNKRYLNPSKIIGITAHIEDIGSFKQDFEENTSVVLEAQTNSSTWIDKIIKSIHLSVDTSIAKKSMQKDSILITVHGIRTGGDWQEEIKKHTSKYTNNFDFYSIKYGVFSLFAFIIPLMRNIKAQSVTKKLEQIVLANEEKDIYIIAHSFGTYLVANFLLKKRTKKIKLVIFSGSVLNKNYFIKHPIENNVNKIINDCGDTDKVLIINKCLIWGLSDAGRIGFTNANSSIFCNRYFNGGHGLYFEKGFYEKYWLPHLLTEIELEPINIKTKWYSDLSEFGFGFLEYFKYLIYLLGFIFMSNLIYQEIILNL